MPKRVDRACGCGHHQSRSSFQPRTTTAIRRIELMPTTTAFTRANHQAIRRASDRRLEFIAAQMRGQNACRLIEYFLQPSGRMDQAESIFEFLDIP
jgi:hypothetical protein